MPPHCRPADGKVKIMDLLEKRMDENMSLNYRVSEEFIFFDPSSVSISDKTSSNNVTTV